MTRHPLQAVGLVVGIVVALIAAITVTVETLPPNDSGRSNAGRERDQIGLLSNKARPFELVSYSASTIPCVGGAESLRCAIATWIACAFPERDFACQSIRYIVFRDWNLDDEEYQAELERRVTAYAVLDRRLITARTPLYVVNDQLEKPQVGDVEITVMSCSMEPEPEGHRCVDGPRTFSIVFFHHEGRWVFRGHYYDEHADCEPNLEPCHYFFGATASRILRYGARPSFDPSAHLPWIPGEFVRSMKMTSFPEP
ncbi:MAG: hypothetical protein FJX65_05510 [Alphaproteobacteria bacterium]|nr:hypothetical protein [Alphaproteobacteria bacterium]